ncbi:MAG: formylglycine-generating enzyme family protein [Sphingomonas sp.]|nr:MAG: formylglycine-generating enzyme family protein [Sphingomonas sp.]
MTSTFRILVAIAALITLPGGRAGSAAPEPEPPSCPQPASSELWIPGGKVRIGTDRGYADEGPAHEVTLKGFWIDQHEVTNRQFATFVAATGYITRAERDGGSIVFRPPGPKEVPVHPRDWWRHVKGADWKHPEGPGSDLRRRGQHPVVHVAYEDALAYADWAGRALPSEEQFEHASRGDMAESLDQPPADTANTWQGRFPVKNDRKDGHAGLAPVGCFKTNSHGLSDMIGNAWEWTRSWYLPSHAPLVMGEGAPGNPSFDPAQPDARVRVIKGGSFLCAPNYCARYRPEARHAQDETAGASHLGFRTIRKVDHNKLAASISGDS